MKKNSDGMQGKSFSAKRRRKPCLMAYTINNYQPVICTIVADQPYFYMEEDGVPEDDLLGLEEYADFEKDIADLKHKMEAYEKLSKNFEKNSAQIMDDFLADAKEITEAAQTSKTEMVQPADKIMMLLAKSRMGLSLLEFAHNSGVQIVESTLVDTAQYDRNTRKIYVHPQLEETRSILLAVRELRRHWQHKKGVLIHPLTFHPDHAIVTNRAQIADLTVSMIRVAWELQLAGYRQAWDVIEHSSMADLGRAFAREAFVDFRSLESGKAAAAAFETWFLSERCRHEDKKLIQAMLADHQGYVFHDTEASRQISIELISALGAQPYGKNYLAQHAKAIIEDPVFTEVRDRSNANFLWFIKFERSFNETEQALQSAEGHSSEGGALPPSTTTQAGQTDDRNATVISLHKGADIVCSSGRPFQSSTLEQDVPGTNVIHVMFGNRENA